jgi:hypothetical protein
MHSVKPCLGAALLLAVALPLTNTSCAGHVYRVYDPYHNDYHAWDDHEAVYYNRWLDENHREHRDYRKLNKEDQKRYWDWRHSHQ